jgi:hypothetical protein
MVAVMTITYHPEVDQGGKEWLALRCGLLTASEMKHIITPTLKIADNDKQRAHLWELLAQRITGYVEPHYISDDMLRGMSDEVDARIAYDKHFAPVTSCGFVTNDEWGFTIGYSPDGLVGEWGLIEAKSRRQRFQIETMVQHVSIDGGTTIPADYLIQHQSGLLVTKRQYCDFISYSGGLPMIVLRVYPDDRVQAAIVEAAAAFEERLQKARAHYEAALQSGARLIPTERKIEQEMTL